MTYYNQEQYVYDSLKSIADLNMTVDYEVLVGDDGSSDKTVLEIEKWNAVFKNRLTILHGNRNDGVSDHVVRASNMRKRLLRESNGDFFCILDGDDYYCDKDFVNKAIDFFASNTELSVVMFNYRYMFSDRIEERKSGMQEGIVQTADYLRYYYTHSGACVYKRITDDEYVIRLSKSIYFDDNDIVIYQLLFGKPQYVNIPILNYRQHNDSIWHSINRAQQGLLNVMGADNEVLLAPEFQDSIYYRYRKDILYTFFRSDYLKNLVGEEYISKCNKIMDRRGLLCGVLLNPLTEDEENIKAVYNIIEKIRAWDPEECDRILINCEKERPING